MNLISTTDPPSFSFLITQHDSYPYVDAAVRTYEKNYCSFNWDFLTFTMNAFSHIRNSLQSVMQENLTPSVQCQQWLPAMQFITLRNPYASGPTLKNKSPQISLWAYGLILS